MKRTLKYALSAVLTAAVVMPALAADNFPDVPDNHWAFEALARLKKDGLLVGYPDGLFRGGRPASRYELAVAIHAVYTNLKSVTDGLDSQIKALGDKLNGVASTSDLTNLRDALTALQNEVNGFKSYGEDIANLKKLSDTFQKELQSLGVDVEALKKDLGDISDRLKKLEHQKPAVNIGGDVDLLLLAGNSASGRQGLSTDGYLEGVKPGTGPGTGFPALPSGLTKDAIMLEEGAFTVSGTNDTGPKWKGTVVIGNMLDTFGGQSVLHAGNAYVEGGSDIYLQDFSVKFDTSIAGLAFNAELGRVGYKVSPYLLQRIDNTTYFQNERWDDGLYRFDGGIVGFNFGSAKLDVFAGNTSKLTSIQGVELNSIRSGNIVSPTAGGVNGGSFGKLVFDQILGGNFNVPITANGNLDLAYLVLDSDNPDTINGVGNADRLTVYGGDLKFNFGKLGLSGGFGQSDLYAGSSTLNNKDNIAWNVNAKYDGNRWGLNGGYREVEANYLAPGDWGQLGILRNPTNIDGFLVGAHFDISSALVLSGGGEFDKGKDDSFGAATAYNTNTKINAWNVGLNYKINSNLNFLLGYSDTEFTGLDAGYVAAGATSASYKWTTIGFGYGLSDTAKLSLQYQISDISNEFQITPGTASRYTGGLLSGQLSIKF